MIGVIAEPYLRFGFSFAFFCVFLSIVFSALRYFTEAKVVFLICSLFFLGMTFGVIRADYSQYKYSYIKSELSSFIGVPHEFNGVVSGDVSRAEQTAKFFISLRSVKVGGKDKNIEGIILATVPRDTTVSYGDEIEFLGTLTEPKNFVTERGDVFDYASYAMARGAHLTVIYPKIKITGNGETSGVIGKLVGLKNIFEEKTRSVFPEPEAGLLNGIVFGTNDSLGEPLTTNLKNTSTVHIVVLSGYNIALVVVALLFLTSFLSKRISILLSVGGIILFVAMVGAEPPAVRSAIMAIIALGGVIFGRPYDAGRALFVAITLMLFQNPAIHSNPSFILSCLATFGIIFFTSPVSLFFYFITHRYNLRELISTTIAAQLSVTPYLIYLVGSFSVVALPANLLVLPAVPFIMIFGFASILASFVIGSFALPLVALTHGLLVYLIEIISFFGELPFAAISFGVISGMATLLFYVIIITVFLIVRKVTVKKW